MAAFRNSVLAQRCGVSVLSAPYSADGNGIIEGAGPQFASLVPGADPYCRGCNIAGVTQPGTIQWLNPDAFVSAVDPASGTCYLLRRRNPRNCQFGTLGRNALRALSAGGQDVPDITSVPESQKASRIKS